MLFLEHAGNIEDAVFFDNFKFEKGVCDEEWFLGYFIKNAMCKCLELFLEVFDNIKIDSKCVRMAKKNNVLYVY